MSKTLHTVGRRIPWYSALQNSWRAALKFDRTQLTPLPAIRSTLVYVLPLALGVATHHVVEGVSIAGGAAMLAAIRLASPYHARIRTLLLACAGIAFSAFVGSLTGQIGWLSVLMAGLWGVGAGVLVALDQTATIAGLQSALALIILSHFALTPLQALLQALLMFSGAVLQALVTMLPAPWQRTRPERLALSNVYRTLSRYALAPPDERSGEYIRDSLAKAYSTLSDTQRESPQGKLFLSLLDIAEHIRLGLIVLTRYRDTTSSDEAMVREMQPTSMQCVQQLVQIAAQELQELATTLQHIPHIPVPIVPLHLRSFSSHDKPHNEHNTLQEMKDILNALRQQEKQAPNAPQDDVTRQVITYGSTLRSQLQKAAQLVAEDRNSYLHVRLLGTLKVSRLRHLHIHDSVAILRANLTLRSAAFRHAIRLGVALALATALYRLFPLPIQRGYWVALTALLILKPDFTTTFARGIARALGTIIGAVLTTLLVTTLMPSQGILVLLDAITAYLAFSVLLANYAVFSVFITMEVVFLLTFVIPQPLDTTAYRAIDTATGSVLALLLYALWPTWERTQTPGLLADRLDALRRYTVAVLQAYANPTTFDVSALDGLLKASRLSRSNADASIQRSLQEPERHRINSDVAGGLLNATDVLVRSVLVLEAYLIDNPARHALPAMATLAQLIDEALHNLATATRENRRPDFLPDFQDAFRALENPPHSKEHTPQTVTLRTDLPIIRSELKQIIRTIHTMYQLLAG